MLLSFRFANHRSFADGQQLNLTPVYESISLDAEPAPDAVPVVGIFGANASGKSNVVSAFDYVSRMVGLSDRESEPGLGPQRQPFRLDPDISAQPSSYAVDLMIGAVHHTYGFILNDQQILEEWLYSYPKRKKRTIFERKEQEFHWGEESGKSNLKRLADITAPTALFLSVSARFDSRNSAERGRDETLAALHDTFSWLWQRMSRARPSTGFLSQARNYSTWLADPDRHTLIVDLLRGADVGLQDVFVRPRDDEDVLEEVSALPEDVSKSERDRLRRPGRRESQVQFLHSGAVGNVTLDIADESSGTLRLLELAARAVPILNRGGLFLVDEIDASLHPLLTASLVSLFRSPSVNRRQAQLVFTTHDATLLGNLDGEDVLERDEIWFTQKRDDGHSELFPLSEFKPRRQGENRQRRYLNGSYGAIPEISMDLFEQALTSRMDTDAD
jgi:AAA15 family ATPase/GTPase